MKGRPAALLTLCGEFFFARVASKLEPKSYTMCCHSSNEKRATSQMT